MVMQHFKYPDDRLVHYFCKGRVKKIRLIRVLHEWLYRNCIPSRVIKNLLVEVVLSTLFRRSLYDVKIQLAVIQQSSSVPVHCRWTS